MKSPRRPPAIPCRGSLTSMGYLDLCVSRYPSPKQKKPSFDYALPEIRHCGRNQSGPVRHELASLQHRLINISPNWYSLCKPPIILWNGISWNMIVEAKGCKPPLLFCVCQMQFSFRSKIAAQDLTCNLHCLQCDLINLANMLDSQDLLEYSAIFCKEGEIRKAKSGINYLT